MGSIEESPIPRPDIAVFTTNGRAYYRILLLLRKIGLSFEDLTMYPEVLRPSVQGSSIEYYLNQTKKVIITTRGERLQLNGENVMCVEDLGDDAGVAKEKLLTCLYPSKSNDYLVIGVDPGERTGVAAFINHREIESTVMPTVQMTVERVAALIDNAPRIAKVVKIGAGNKRLAGKIASLLEARYRNEINIHLVDERGTTSSAKRGNANGETKDQRAAKLIAFRDGTVFTRFS